MLQAVALAARVHAPIKVGGMLVNPEQLLVKPAVGYSAKAIRSIYQSRGCELVRDIPQLGWQVIRVPEKNLLKMRSQFANDKRFSDSQFDKASRLAYTPNDPLFPDQTHMLRIKADLAWDTEKGDPSVRVAIMDTGVNVAHPDLAANIWTNPGETPGNSIDDDGNGYIDDVNGYDFAYNDSNPDDQYGHGTGCAGIAAARQDNAIGVSGVAPYVKIVAVKAALDSGYFYDSANVPALVYIADMGFEVVSMSFYSDGVTPAERDAIDYCWNHNVVPVVAAGNDAQVFPYYPAAYDNAIAVAALNTSNNKASFSNWGTWVDVAAPGTSLTTTAVGGDYGGFSGTSGACPHVAGLAALLFSANPSATNAQVRAAIEDTAIATVQSPYGQYTSYGRIDCQAAVARINGQTSGSVTPRMLFAAPVGGGIVSLPQGATDVVDNTISIHGVGLEAPNIVRVLRDGIAQTILERTRNWVKVPINGSIPATYSLEVNSTVIGTFRFEGGSGLSYAPTDASTSGAGASSSGGFTQLYRNDGQTLSCDESNDNAITLVMPIRKLGWKTPRRIDLSFRRAYANNNGGLETIELYDWSTASYPYGSFVTVSSQTIASSAAATLNIALTSNPARFIDPEGTMYVRVTTTAPGTGATIAVDSMRATLR